jgi:hypothetical protein
VTKKKVAALTPMHGPSHQSNFQDNRPRLNPPAPAHPGLFARIRANFGWKVLLFLTLSPAFTLFYYVPQWIPIFAPSTIPLTPLDERIPFRPWWIWPYMSMYVMLPLTPMLATRARDLWRYTVGMTIMFVTCCVFFFLWPVAYPRPRLIDPAAASGFYKLVTSIDQPINSLPSLHAGLTAYTMFFAARALRDLPRRTFIAIQIIGWIWAAVILYGTLATKQHYLIDLPPGILIAWIAHWLAWRKADMAVAVEKR